MTPADVIELVKNARASRAAAAPASRPASSGRSCRRRATSPKYLVCNADESEPGSFKDRILIERGPHQMLEGILIAAWATGAEKTFIYIRGEYAEPARILAARHRRGLRRGATSART